MLRRPYQPQDHRLKFCRLGGVQQKAHNLTQHPYRKPDYAEEEHGHAAECNERHKNIKDQVHGLTPSAAPPRADSQTDADAVYAPETIFEPLAAISDGLFGRELSIPGYYFPTISAARLLLWYRRSTRERFWLKRLDLPP
jgi:hypothetical protein